MTTSKLSYVALDFETSGIDPTVDVPVEVCAVRVVEGEPVATFNALIDYPVTMPWTEALQHGHHSREDLMKGMPERKVAEILAYMCMGELLVAYNALFDLSFLRAMIARNLSGDTVIDFDSTFSVLDPLVVVRDRDPSPHKLVDTCRRRGIAMGDAHLALDDTLSLVELTNQLHEQQDIAGYVNYIKYKRQYGLPKYARWIPPRVILEPTGAETFYHHSDGNTTRQAHIGAPPQRVIMGKPIAPSSVPTHPAPAMPPAQQVVVKTPFHTISRTLPPPPLGN